MLESKRGMVGWTIVIAAFFVWIIVIAFWYKNPEPVLNLTDKTSILIALWWTIVCGICVFVGMRMEKERVAG